MSKEDKKVYLENPIYSFRKDLKDYVAKRSDGLYQIEIDGQIIITSKKQIKMLVKRINQMLEAEKGGTEKY